MLVPLRYNLRSLLVRRSATLLTALGIGATVAIFAGVLSLEAGFRTLFERAGREDVFLFLRPGASSEGESMWRRDKADRLIKTLPEIRRGAQGQPLAAMECYLAVRRFRIGGGETNVPVRGVEPAAFDIHGDDIRIVAGRRFRPGADEVIVGKKLVGRIRNCELGDTIQLNLSPLLVVGVFDSDGPFASEIWGDLDRMRTTLNRPDPNSIVALLAPDADVLAMKARLREDPELPAEVRTEREHLSAQTSALSEVLLLLGGFLATVMGVAAVFTATNTMLAAVSARTHEIGILLAAGFRPIPIFLAFLLESLLLGLLGGAIGCAVVLPLHGLETGATNFNTFTEVAFAFRVTPSVLATAVTFAVALGLLGGAVPAWHAARMAPVVALRRR
jgi:ABC-type antimicrobial peptide transport system permease subunit